MPRLRPQFLCYYRSVSVGAQARYWPLAEPLALGGNLVPTISFVVPHPTPHFSTFHCGGVENAVTVIYLATKDSTHIPCDGKYIIVNMCCVWIDRIIPDETKNIQGTR